MPSPQGLQTCVYRITWIGHCIVGTEEFCISNSVIHHKQLIDHVQVTICNMSDSLSVLYNQQFKGLVHIPIELNPISTYNLNELMNAASYDIIWTSNDTSILMDEIIIFTAIVCIVFIMLLWWKQLLCFGKPHNEPRCDVKPSTSAQGCGILTTHSDIPHPLYVVTTDQSDELV